MRYTKDEKQQIIEKTKAAAMAIAELWDALAVIENRTGRTVSYSKDLLDAVAGEYGIPPQWSDLSSNDVWDAWKTFGEVS